MADVASSTYATIRDVITLFGGEYGLWIIAGYYFAMVGGERLWYALRRPGL